METVLGILLLASGMFGLGFVACLASIFVHSEEPV